MHYIWEMRSVADEMERIEKIEREVEELKRKHTQNLRDVTKIAEKVWKSAQKYTPEECQEAYGHNVLSLHGKRI